MEAQVTAAAKAVFYQLWKIQQLAPYLSLQDLATVTHAMVTFRLDYCNLLYTGFSLGQIQKLQWV